MGSTSQHANVLGYAMNNDLTAPLFKSLLGANTWYASYAATSTRRNVQNVQSLLNQSTLNHARDNSKPSGTNSHFCKRHVDKVDSIL